MEFMTQKIARLFLSTMVLMLLTAFFGDISRAEDPDFSKVHDILQGGQRNIGRADDLVIARPVPVPPKETKQKNLIATLDAKKWTISGTMGYSESSYVLPVNPYWPYPQQTRTARLFYQENDVLVMVAPNDSSLFNMAIHVEDRVNLPDSFGILFNFDPSWLTAAVADFNMDGCDDMLVMNTEEAFVATAKHVMTPGSGLIIGPRIETGHALTPLGEPTTGDFNGDGLLDVAWIGADVYKGGGLSVFFATVCPDKVSGTICDEAEPLEIILNPLSAEPIPLSAKIGPPSLFQLIPANALTAGDFLPGPGDELLVTYVKMSEGTPTQLGQPLVGELYRFGDQMKSARADGTVFLQNSLVRPNNVYAVSAPIKGSNRTDQAVVAWSCYYPDGVKRPGYSTSMAVVTFDEGSSPVMERWMSVDYENRGKAHLSGLAVGRFNDLPTGVAEISDYDLDIAVMFGPDNVTCKNGIGNHVNLVSVGNGPDDYRPYGGVPTAPDFGFDCPGARDEQASIGNRSGSRLRSGDLRGRSVRLGDPLVARINSHKQPRVILGSPPMHVDYIQPDSQTVKQADVINFSALWNSFHSVYDIDTRSTQKSTTQHTTSYTHACTKTVESEAVFKFPFVPSPDSKEKTIFKDAYEKLTKATFDTYASKTIEASTRTGFGDQVWYTSSRFNVYFYPALGKRVCPAEKPECTDDEKEPYYLVVSGPDHIANKTVNGRGLEWYNPIHIPGNIFSYPATPSQLQDRISGAQLLTPEKSFFTDSSTRTVKINWSKGSGADVSSGSSETHSFDTNHSASLGSVTFVKDFFGAGGGGTVTGSLEYNKSKAFSSLFSSSTTLAASAGIAVHKPNGFLDPSLYQYMVTPAIFGQALPDGRLQDMTTSTDIQTHGVLQASYAADPTDPAAGLWWTSGKNPYRNHIDVALNHPLRWEPTGDGSGLACLGGRECVSFNGPDGDDIWTSKFYHMRGLLVTAYSKEGPQRGRAEEGQLVFLRARIYNLSLKDMDPGTEIHARFYRQKWKSKNIPEGDSVLISEEVIHPLPGFNTESQNWTEVSTSFDTTGLGDSYWLFWVVVWAEDGSGHLTTEVPGHGLATVADKEKWKWITDVPLEEVAFDGKRTSFSNNVGVLKRAFYIAGKSNKTGNRNGELVVEAVTATPIGFSHNTPVEFLVAAEVVSYDGDATNGVTVEFYDGDPIEAGVLFDVENIAHLRRNEVNHVRIRYRPLALGPQEIVVLARHGSETARGEVTFEALPIHR